MKVYDVRFFRSVFNLSEIPRPTLPEVAFTGRSNVGKSTLINTLINRKGFAKTSSTPGRTQSINFIDVNGAVFFVDLPGYGYANVPAAIRKQWQPLIEGYLKNRATLQVVILIVDVRRDPKDEEASFVEWLTLHKIPLLVVITKIDKVSKDKQKKSLRHWEKFLDAKGNVIMFSGLTGAGKEKVWKALTRILQ
jgi:GTP-binding protein